MTKISSSDLETCLNYLNKLITDLHVRRFEAFVQDKAINESQFNRLGDCERSLESCAGILATNIIRLKLQELEANSSKDQIVTATKKVNNAVKQLENVDKTLNLLANIINLFTTITTAIQNVSLANISGILDVINKF